MADPAGEERPLLVDSVQGDERGLDIAGLGQVLILLGGAGLLALVVLSITSAPSLERGWEGSWFLPRSQFFFAVPLSLGALVAGSVLYLLGRGADGRDGPSDDDAEE